MRPLKLKLSERKYRDDPWAEFSRLRKLGNVIRIKMPFMGKSWAATSYDTVNEVLKNSELFVRNPANAGRKTFIPMQWIFPRSLFAVARNMLTADGNDHRRLRLLVDRAFAMRNIDQMDEQIHMIANRQLDQLESSLNSSGRADLMLDFARPFPLTVICELLGLPLEDRPKFMRWFEPFSTVSSVFGIFKMRSGINSAIKYLHEQFDIVRKNPRPGLITKLVEAELEGDRLSDDELLSMVFLLLVAGHETTVHLISNLVLTLLEHPHSKDEVIANPALIDAAIEETLRYCSPVQLAKPRYVSKDCVFEGMTLHRGQLMTPILACANYDPKRFENPLVFDIHRKKNYHMTFGSGPHVCLGMKLARAETANAFKCLFGRFPDLKADFDLKNPNWGKRMGLRNLTDFFVSNG